MKVRFANWGMSKKSARVDDSPGYIVHAAAWRETSLILQILTRDHGVVVVVAKGAKRPYSALRAVLAPFQPLQLAWRGAGEVHTLVRAELAGYVPVQGRALMSAWYLNELVLQMLPREDPHPRVFDAYHVALHELASGRTAAPALRRFEWTLLHEAGYGLDADMPDFTDMSKEPQLRASLRERLSHVLERPLRTRTILMELQQL